MEIFGIEVGVRNIAATNDEEAMAEFIDFVSTEKFKIGERLALYEVAKSNVAFEEVAELAYARSNKEIIELEYPEDQYE